MAKMFTEYFKAFFGSSWKGIVARGILGLILFFVVTLVHALSWRITDNWALGWPLYFSESWGPCPAGEICQSSYRVALIFDIVLWYFVSCLIVFAIGSMKLKKQ